MATTTPETTDPLQKEVMKPQLPSLTSSSSSTTPSTLPSLFSSSAIASTLPTNITKSTTPSSNLPPVSRPAVPHQSNPTSARSLLVRTLSSGWASFKQTSLQLIQDTTHQVLSYGESLLDPQMEQVQRTLSSGAENLRNELSNDSDLRGNIERYWRDSSHNLREHLPSGENYKPTRKLFGLSLSQAVEVDEKTSQVRSPLLIRKSILFLIKNGMDKEELFLRGDMSDYQSALQSLVSYIKTKYEEGETIDLSEYDEYVIAGLLVLFFKCLPVPLLHDLPDDLLNEMEEQTEEQKKKTIQDTLQSLSPATLVVTVDLFQLLNAYWKAKPSPSRIYSLLPILGPSLSLYWSTTAFGHFFHSMVHDYSAIFENK